MRTLASIQRITAIDPIHGADNVELASVLGWKVVVRIEDRYKAGDLALYMEIDSIPPDEEQYRFLWKFAEQRPNNFRIKTKQMPEDLTVNGQRVISQGIVFPLSKIGDTWGMSDDDGDMFLGVREGDDVTETLGVTKYEAPLPRGSDDIVGQFFDGVPKTDEERVQSSTGAKHLESLRGRPYYITEKQDGASMTIAMHEGFAKVASRNYRLADIEGSAYWSAAWREYGQWNDPMLHFVVARPWLAMQGELVGPGIQNNRLELKHHECRIFNIYDRNDGRLWTLAEMLEASEDWGFPLVPVIEVGHLFNYTQDQLLTLAEGKYAGTKNEREGIVIRSNSGLESVSFKAVSNRYLLKGGE